MKYDYDNLHSSLWENHKVTWTASSLFIPIIFTLEGYFVQQYFEKFSKYTYLEQLSIFIFGAILIQSLAIIWYFVMSSFHNLNENRIIRLKEIEIYLNDCAKHSFRSYNFKCQNDSIKEFRLVNQYNSLFSNIKKDESKEKSETNSQNLQTVSAEIRVRQAAEITWNPPAEITHGTPLCGSHLNAKARDPTTNADISNNGTFTYSKKDDGTSIDIGTVLDVGKHNLIATFTPIFKNCSIHAYMLVFIKRLNYTLRVLPVILIHLLVTISHLLASLLSVFFLIGYVPFIMPLVLMKKYNIFEDCTDKDKRWHIMKIYLLVVLLLYSLNLVIFVYLLSRAINDGAPQLGNDFANLTVYCVNSTVNIIDSVAKVFNI